QAGLVMGAKAFNTGMKIVGAACGYGDISAMKDKVRGIVEEAKERYDLDFVLNDKDLIVHNQYAGDGYGIMSDAKLEAVKLLSETEGIMIDPVYTSVAMACIIDQIKQGNFKKTDNVVFLHTGGAVALFPYKEPLRAQIEGKPLPWKVPEWSPQSE
ncbi:pyridoxal-phosphate dependent enzyme, partial [Candidatus Bathyarchaeota archaeon]|nr:pyridoxal-phosphate dependent enzyme [Candidatus Bathyarchaeota archaeon]